jgi:hypothetical protein
LLPANAATVRGNPVASVSIETRPKLAVACGSDHPLVEPGGWTTRKRKDGTTEWIPPPHHDHAQPHTNTFHHPEKLLADEDDDR